MTECIYCNKTFNYPSKWIRHCATKKHIKNVEKATESENNMRTNENNFKANENNFKANENNMRTIENKNVAELPKTPIESFNCKYCDKTFKHRTSRDRHMRNACKEKLQQGTTINNINNTTNNIIHNHVHINVYGNEDFSKLMSPEFFEELKELTGLQRQDKMITHMYTAAPNNTARIPNMNQPYCITMGEEGEIKQSLKPVIDNILDNLPENTEQMFITYIKSLPNYFQKKTALGIYNEIMRELKESITNATKRKEIEKIVKAALYNN